MILSIWSVIDKRKNGTFEAKDFLHWNNHVAVVDSE